ncbi:MAG: division/cell wall cluster transcriptional repressor MraZ [Rhodospirillaceae bacterium]
MALFLSTFVNKVDRKGRVSVPASWRARLSAQPFQGVIVFPSVTGLPCLEGMDMSAIEAMADNMDQFDVFSTAQDDRANLIFAQSRELPFDPEGRILLPADLLEQAGISEQAAFVGLAKRFQIWEPAAHKAMLAEVRTRATSERPTVPVKGGAA